MMKMDIRLPTELARDTDHLESVLEVRPTIVVASTTECVPCTQMKPIIRKLALDYFDRVAFVELDSSAAPQWLREHKVEAYPEMLFFRDGVLIDRLLGFHGAEATRDFVSRAAGSSGADTPTEHDLAFSAAMASAEESVERTMQSASDAIGPEIEAVQPKLDALTKEFKIAVASGTMTREAAGALLRTERNRLYAPFQHKIDALRAAQDTAMQQYETETTLAVQRYAEAVKDRVGATLVCDTDGKSCRWVSHGEQPGPAG